MSIVGVDLSSRAVHLCTLAEDADIADIHVVRLDLPRAGSHVERARRLRDRMPSRGAWTDAGVTLVAIEEPFFRGHQGLAPLLLVYGGLLQLIPPELPLLELRADDWRKELGLPVRRRKGEDDDVHKQRAVMFASDHWTNLPPILDADSADAFCLAWAARQIDNRRQQAA